MDSFQASRTVSSRDIRCDSRQLSTNLRYARRDPHVLRCRQAVIHLTRDDAGGEVLRAYTPVRVCLEPIHWCAVDELVAGSGASSDEASVRVQPCMYLDPVLRCFGECNCQRILRWSRPAEGAAHTRGA